jgi:hypothetical protein
MKSNDTKSATLYKILGLPIVLAIKWAIIFPERENFWLKIFTLTNRLPDSPEGFRLYAKSYWVSDGAKMGLTPRFFGGTEC